MFPFIGMEESLSSPITSPPTSPCMPPFTPCYVQEPLDSASSSVESDCDYSILVDSLASSNDSDFSHMQDELDKICDHHLQTSLSSNTMNESELQSGEGGMSVNTGYKIVFDNIDKNVAPRFMRNEHQTRSLHYVHSYAVKDRLDFSNLSSQRPTNFNVFGVIPDVEDYKYLKSDFAVLIKRIIVEYIPFFHEDYEGLPLKHISLFIF